MRGEIRTARSSRDLTEAALPSWIYGISKLQIGNCLLGGWARWSFSLVVGYLLKGSVSEVAWVGRCGWRRGEDGTHLETLGFRSAEVGGGEWQPPGQQKRYVQYCTVHYSTDGQEINRRRM